MELPALHVAALLVGGLAAGVINTVAGGGSLIGLPLLVLLGLPPTVANGTNRVAVLAQSLVAARTFHVGEALPWPTVRRLALPTVGGAVLGAALASRIPDVHFRPVLGVVLLLMAGVVVLRPSAWLKPAGDAVRAPGPALILGFFAIGLYGGFLQAGVGFFLLAGLVPGLGLDLVRANGVKVALVGMLTALALGVFVLADQVDWTSGAVLAVGNAAGGYLGSRLAIARGARWVRVVLVVMVGASALEILGVRRALFGLLG